MQVLEETFQAACDAEAIPGVVLLAKTKSGTALDKTPSTSLVATDNNQVNSITAEHSGPVP